jgi:signal transduction histidine kinase
LPVGFRDNQSGCAVSIEFLTQNFILIYFLYGLAFFSMGLAVLLEASQQSELRLARALGPLALFGLMHGVHEWGEMFQRIIALTSDYHPAPDQEALRLVWLVTSFNALAVFGLMLTAPESSAPGQRRMLLFGLPFGLTVLWALGIPLLRPQAANVDAWLVAVDVWGRYTLGIPAALLACWGLVRQQHWFREHGLESFGRDSLWAAVAFGWYGVIGQAFTPPSYIFPSTVLNSTLFLQLFGIPVELFRGGMAALAAFFVIRSLRAFEVKRQEQLANLQAARLQEVERREALRGDLLRQVVSAQEAERQRIARELHDETGQSLTGLSLGLRSLRSSLRSDPALAERNAQELETLAVRAIDELRRFVSDLRPAQLDDLGLVPALRWYCQEVQARAGLQVECEVPAGRVTLPAEVSTVLFRIAQEALTNIVRHAQARRVTVRLHLSTEDARLFVQDDGRGFDPQAMLAAHAPRRAWGLVGMQERAALVGGFFQVTSAPGQGAEVLAVIPLPPAQEQPHETTARG